MYGGTLPPKQRLALALRELHGMRYAQIADALGTSVGAVETLLVRARQRFRRSYAASHPQISTVCEDVLERLSASIDGELAADEQARIDAHLPMCANCQFAARELRATSRLYGLLPWLAPAAAEVATAAAVAATGAGGCRGRNCCWRMGALAALGSINGGVSTAAAVVLTISALWCGGWPEEAVTWAAPHIPTPVAKTQSVEWLAAVGWDSSRTF